MSIDSPTQPEAPLPTASSQPKPAPRGSKLLVVILVLIAFAGGIVATLWSTGALDQWMHTAPRPLADNAMLVPASDPAPLTTQTTASALETRMAALSGRLDQLSAEAVMAGNHATRAEGLLIAFAARRVLDNGAQLGYLENELRARFSEAQPRAVATILSAAHEPVTLIQLQAGLDELTPALMGKRDNGDWWTATQRELSNLVIIRKASSPSPLPEKSLQRARSFLLAGRVDAALAEVESLPGRANADRWVQMARRYNEARRALDVIEAAAILDPRPMPGAPPLLPTLAPVTVPVTDQPQSTTSPIKTPAFRLPSE